MSSQVETAAARTGSSKTEKPARGARRFQLNSAHWTVISLLSTLLLWWLVVIVLEPADYILPSPFEVIERLGDDSEMYLEHAVPTTSIIVTGFALGLLVGVIGGIAIAAINILDRIFYPLIIAFNSIPKVALAPLFVVWFGYGATPRVLITFSIAFFPILVNTITGLRSIDDGYIQLARSMGAPTLRTFLKIRLPHALPNIFAGVKVATSLAVIGGIIGEFVASDEGWGYLLTEAQGNLDTTSIFAILVLLSVFATILFYIVELIERITIPWHSSQRS